MTVTYVIDKPKVIMKLSVLNKFKHYKEEQNKYSLLNKHQISDFVGGVILEDMIAPCVVHSVNDCTDEVRNGAVVHENKLNKDGN